MGITKSNINFSINELGHLFPFYLIIDENHNILSFGKSLGALFPEMIIGEMFFNKWKIVRPLTEISTDFSLNLLTNKLVVIAHQQNTSLKLKGQFERYNLKMSIYF